VSALLIGPAISGNYQASLLYMDALDLVGGLLAFWGIAVALRPMLAVFVQMIRIRREEGETRDGY
jgi:hypothetical protein